MTQNQSVEVKELTVCYHDDKALDTISLSLPEKQIVGIIGPNGAGKSTLIKAIIGMLPLQNGVVKVFGDSIKKVRKRIAYVPQRNQIDMDFPVLVEDVVLMGRYPHVPWFLPPGKKDRAIAKKCLEQVGMFEFRHRQIGELSGGQQQRVFIARALAQEADLFLLDEPFVGIDITSEKIIVNLLKELRDQGKTLLVVHHDLSKATEYFDSLVILNKKLIASGNSREVFHVRNLEQAYKGSAAILTSDSLGTMVVSG